MKKTDLVYIERFLFWITVLLLSIFIRLVTINSSLKEPVKLFELDTTYNLGSNTIAWDTVFNNLNRLDSIHGFKTRFNKL